MDEKIKDIIINYKSLPNKDLVKAMDFLNEDFEKTKELLLKLTDHLSGIESSYYKILDEYQKRTKR